MRIAGEEEMNAISRLLAPWRSLTDPKFFDMNRVPLEGPFMLVGNHTLFGVLDVPLLVTGIHEERGRLLRSVGDHAHFKVPGWRTLLLRFGGFEGTRANCRRLMRRGEPILVYPGGAREVFKRKGEKYRLIWKERVGFVRLAVEFGYPILPFGAVGAEEAFDIVIDAEDRIVAPITNVVRSITGRDDALAPIVTGLWGTPLPRIERFYFAFGEPVPTADVRGRQDDALLLRELRDRVRARIEERISFLIELRRTDPKRTMTGRARRALVRLARPL